MNIQACLPVSSAFPSPQALLLPYRIEGRMTAGHVLSIHAEWHDVTVHRGIPRLPLYSLLSHVDHSSSMPLQPQFVPRVNN
jgi:hypothetical protein